MDYGSELERGHHMCQNLLLTYSFLHSADRLVLNGVPQSLDLLLSFYNQISLEQEKLSQASFTVPYGSPWQSPLTRREISACHITPRTQRQALPTRCLFQTFKFVTVSTWVMNALCCAMCSWCVWFIKPPGCHSAWVFSSFLGEICNLRLQFSLFR